MPDELYDYYARELTFLRQLGADYARKYPKTAGRLGIEPDKCDDPHVERLLQGFAFLAARIQHKLDDEFPEISESLLSVVYPHYLSPVPSMSIAQFVLDPGQGKLTSGYVVPRGSRLYTKQSVDGTPCRFRTAYPVTLWPLEVASVRLTEPDQWAPAPRAAMMLRLELRALGGVPFPELAVDTLRFYLYGESRLAAALYELLFTRVCEVQLRPVDGPSSFHPIRCAPDVVRPVGFRRDEGLLPYSLRSFLGYQHLLEYFAFPEKFLFIDVSELQRAAGAEFQAGVQICFILDQRPKLEQALGPETFRLGCTPIVNLFGGDGPDDRFIAEPIPLTQTEAEYRIVPNLRCPNGFEVYGVDRVLSLPRGAHDAVPLEPFYSFRHGTQRGGQSAFWFTTRKSSQREDDGGSEVFLSLVDLDFEPQMGDDARAQLDGATLTLHVTCTNRELPSKLQGYGGGRGEFEIEGAAPPAQIVCLRVPTKTARPSLRGGVQWRLISHLALNHLSIVDGGEQALQEILSLYNYFSDRDDIQQQIEGIVDITSRRVVRTPASMPRYGFCRGVEVTMTFDKEKYAGTGVFLFAAVLEHFVGLYASLNSFTQLVAKTKDGVLKRWPPRAGEQILV